MVRKVRASFVETSQILSDQWKFGNASGPGTGIEYCGKEEECADGPVDCWTMLHKAFEIRLKSHGYW